MYYEKELRKKQHTNKYYLKQLWGNSLLHLAKIHGLLIGANKEAKSSILKVAYLCQDYIS